MWSAKIDLKLRLSLQVVAWAAVCFSLASTYAVFESNRSAQTKAAWTAAIVAKDLELQQDQMSWVRIKPATYPDLQTVAGPLLTPGLCIAYRAQNGVILQSLCNGPQPDRMDAPAWFAALYRSTFDPGAEAVHPVASGNAEQGAAVVTLDPDSLIGQSWHETSRLLAVMAVTLLALCILVYAALARALRPTRIIVAGLERLAANDLSARLPPLDLAELSAVGDVFNTLAETLQNTLGERNELTKRLIAVQDEERRNLARELHDEFGQCLAGISAVAAALGHTAQQECPALLPECRSIGRISAHMMETLRGALARLRPPDVEEIGLVASLESLVAGWNSWSGGRTRFTVEVSGNVDALPLPFGASLYRIAQEAISNAAKHAQASRVDLHLRMSAADAATADRQGEEIELIVEDDGRASDIDLKGKSGMGLLGMRERVAALGGRLSFEARRPNGLILRAVVDGPPITNI
jgi:signal transduction histidine kinase